MVKFWRARTCASWRARGQDCQYVALWPEVYVYWIWLIYDKRYEDINDNVKTQNGAWMTSWLSDQTEKRRFSIPDNDKDTVKISTWLLILFLIYHGPKIHTERNNENKIRTDSIGDMPLYGISPNYAYPDSLFCYVSPYIFRAVTGAALWACHKHCTWSRTHSHWCAEIAACHKYCGWEPGNAREATLL